MLKINKIYNEDCIKFMNKLPNNSVNLIIADPPYGIAKKKPLKGNSHGNIKTLDAEWDVFNSKEEYIAFSKQWINKCNKILKDNGSIFVYGTRQSIFDMKNLLDEIDLYYMDMITWIKRDAPPNVTCRMYSHSTEFILWYCKSNKGWIFNHDIVKKYNNGKQMRNYWDIQRSMKKDEKTNHPTQKKIELSDIILDGHSNENDLVYIPFAGSGSEIESCIIKNRNWIATEKNLEYIDDIIIPRINKLEV